MNFSFPTPLTLEQFIEEQIENYNSFVEKAKQPNSQGVPYVLSCMTDFGDRANLNVFDFDEAGNGQYCVEYAYSGIAAMNIEKLRVREFEMNQMVLYTDALHSKLNELGGWWI